MMAGKALPRISSAFMITTTNRITSRTGTAWRKWKSCSSNANGPGGRMLVVDGRIEARATDRVD